MKQYLMKPRKQITRDKIFQPTNKTAQQNDTKFIQQNYPESTQQKYLIKPLLKTTHNASVLPWRALEHNHRTIPTVEE